MKKVLLTGAYPYTREQINQIEALGVQAFFVQDERGGLEKGLLSADAVVCNGLFLYHDIKAFTGLKMIQLTSAGLDRVPLAYIKEKGIALYNARGVYSIPMAEWVVLKILELYKHSAGFYRAQGKRNGTRTERCLSCTVKRPVLSERAASGRRRQNALGPSGLL